MGITPRFASRSSYDSLPSHPLRSGPSIHSKKLPNPDPTNYRIVRAQTIKKVGGVGCFTVVMVHYPDCTNYEGNKILVFENADVNDLNRQQSIDPHFSNSTKFKSPIARYEPTARGWDMAKDFCIFMAHKY